MSQYHGLREPALLSNKNKKQHSQQGSRFCAGTNDYLFLSVHHLKEVASCAYHLIR
jgi:hypothetical protein